MSSVDAFLKQAGEREKEYDWLDAAEFCKKAIGLVSETDFLKLGQVQERVGYAFYRAAMQADSVTEFRDRMSQSIAHYKKAKESYEKMSESGKTPRILRCDATIAYIGYWLASEVPEKKRLLDECWKLTKQSLEAFEEAGDACEYGKTYNQLSWASNLLFALEWNPQSRDKTIREALEHGERAIILLSNIGDSGELSKAYVKTALSLGINERHLIPDIDEKERCNQKAMDYWRKANELSEDAALLELLTAIVVPLNLTYDKMLTHFRNALELAKKTKDRILIGAAMDWLAYANFRKGYETEDPDKRLEIQKRALQYAENANQYFSIICFLNPRGFLLWSGAPHCDYYFKLAYFFETDMKKRRGLFEMAVVKGAQLVEQAESSGYPNVISYAHHILSNALGALAQTETKSEEKRRLLEKALTHKNESIKIIEQLEPFDYWGRGVRWNYVADLIAELSNIEENAERRKDMLEEAIQNKEHALELCSKGIIYLEKTGFLEFFLPLGVWQSYYGELLSRLYGLTNNSEHQRRAINAFEEAAESYQRVNLKSRVAECHWKLAQAYDSMSEHLKAAENFESASEYYKLAAEKIPQLKDFYQDLSLYMQAWNEIEKARHHHVRQEYGMAEEQFEKAADLHKSLKKWSYLAPNYAAWARIEHAEELSRKEQSEEATRAFEQAAELFSETKKSVQAKLDKIEDPDEKQMATSLVKTTSLRLQYCKGRTALEEAQILDRRGDHYSSSQQYGSAVETFEKISHALESEQEHKEFEFIISLSRAWQGMMLAEARASPELYMEASQLFEQASEQSDSERTSFLTLGHSRFCKALEAGTKFADTRDATLHAVAIQHLESAANYYVKAGFQNASEYAKATELLLDAYVHMDNAKKETDPEKKTRLYTMAEKVLQTSAGSFMKAEHPEKREQVLRLLDKVKEDRELAISLAEVLHAPAIVSATSAFSTPDPTHESAVGLERFEHADIQANMITRQKELKVGESLNLEIELINAGKGPALLIKLTEVIPEGFDLTEKPENYRIEDSYLNMKGKRLDPLKTEEVRLVLRSKTQGVFPLKPTILYLDENGKYKSHEPEPINITVKELGIKGWIKGER